MSVDEARVLDRSVDAARWQVPATMLGLALCAPAIAAFAHWRGASRISDSGDPAYAVAWCVALVLTAAASLFVHEAIHGAVIGWRSGLGRRAYRFGRKSMMMYCQALVPLRVDDYRLVIIAPAVLLGVLPSVLAVLFGWWFALAIGVLQLAGAGGDLLALWLLRKDPPHWLATDHPTRIGCTVEVRE